MSSQSFLYILAGTTLAGLFALAIARVVNDTLDDGGDESAHGDCHPAPLLDASFHEAQLNREVL